MRRRGARPGMSHPRRLLHLKTAPLSAARAAAGVRLSSRHTPAAATPDLTLPFPTAGSPQARPDPRGCLAAAAWQRGVTAQRQRLSASCWKAPGACRPPHPLASTTMLGVTPLSLSRRVFGLCLQCLPRHKPADPRVHPTAACARRRQGVPGGRVRQVLGEAQGAERLHVQRGGALPCVPPHRRPRRHTLGHSPCADAVHRHQPESSGGLF